MKVFIAGWSDGYELSENLGVYTTEDAARLAPRCTWVDGPFELDALPDDGPLSIAESRIIIALGLPDLCPTARVLLKQALASYPSESRKVRPSDDK